MKHHHARGPEETVCDVPPMVPAGRASRKPPTCLREAGMPDIASAEDPGQLASAEHGLRHRMADRPTRLADPVSAGAIAFARSIEPTTVGVRERPVRSPRR
jgi:hypothetical protein